LSHPTKKDSRPLRDENVGERQECKPAEHVSATPHHEAAKRRPIARDCAGHDWAATSGLQTCLVIRKRMADAISSVRRPLRGEDPNPILNWTEARGDSVFPRLCQFGNRRQFQACSVARVRRPAVYRNRSSSDCRIYRVTGGYPR
jgi:hypothetical protein